MVLGALHVKHPGNDQQRDNQRPFAGKKAEIGGKTRNPQNENVVRFKVPEERKKRKAQPEHRRENKDSQKTKDVGEVEKNRGGFTKNGVEGGRVFVIRGREMVDRKRRGGGGGDRALHYKKAEKEKTIEMQ